jgi:hypothetical protein
MRKRSPAVTKDWQVRWFVLDRYSISWYRFKSDLRSNMRGGIALSSVTGLTIFGRNGNMMKINMYDRTVILMVRPTC